MVDTRIVIAEVVVEEDQAVRVQLLPETPQLPAAGQDMRSLARKRMAGQAVPDHFTLVIARSSNGEVALVDQTNPLVVIRLAGEVSIHFTDLAVVDLEYVSLRIKLFRLSAE